MSVDLCAWSDFKYAAWYCARQPDRHDPLVACLRVARATPSAQASVAAWVRA
jgi:hypothetical protein